MSKESLVRLSPPWYTFFNFVKHSIAEDRCVDVLDMKEMSDCDFLIPIEVKDRNRAIALASILVPCKNFGNINVRIEISHCGRIINPCNCICDARGILRLFEEAFCTNCYFECVECVEIFGAARIFPVFKKEVIQFFNDDLSDLYSNFNGVAADVFAEVLKPQIDGITINPSTANSR